MKAPKTLNSPYVLTAAAAWMVLAAVTLAGAGPAHAQTNAIAVTTSNFTNNFPNSMTFSVEATAPAEVQTLALIVQLNGIASSSRFTPKFSPGKGVSAKFDWDLKSQSSGGYIPPGVRGNFWWHIEDSAGNKFDSPPKPFFLDDITQKWKKLENDKVALYWSNGADSFGKQLYDRGNSAIDFLQKDLEVTITNQIQILVYGNRADFFRSSEPGQAEWTGGRTYSDYGVILIHIEPTNLDWGLGATSHELTHAVIHEKIKGAFGDLSLPHWMDEGLAVYNQTTEHSPDIQFEGPLRRAIQTNTLISLRALSGNFPADPTAANLSYGESYAVVDFMFKQFGKEKVAQLLQVFKKGATHDESFKQIVGLNIDELENSWRKSVGAPLRVISIQATSTPGAFPTFAFSSADTAVPGATKSSPAAPTQVAAAQATTVPQATPPSGGNSSAPNAAPGLCGGLFGLFGAASLGIFLKRRPRLE